MIPSSRKRKLCSTDSRYSSQGPEGQSTFTIVPQLPLRKLKESEAQVCGQLRVKFPLELQESVLLPQVDSAAVREGYHVRGWNIDWRRNRALVVFTESDTDGRLI